MKELLLKTCFVLLCAVMSIGSANADSWTRCTAVSDITDGGTFIIGYEATANSGKIIPMKITGGTATATTAGYMASGSEINMSTVTATEDYEVEIVASTKVQEAVCIKIGDNFLGNTDTKNNCKLFDEEAATTAFTLSVTTNDVFTFKIKANDTYTTLQYNASSPRFAVYGGTQKNLVVYKKTASSAVPVPVEGVSLTDAAGNAIGSYAYLTVTDQLQLKAVVTPSNATNKKVTWEVYQDKEVISFDNGLVTALAEGMAAVVATTEDGEKQAAVTIYVNPIPNSLISVFLDAKGKTCYLTGTVSDIVNTTYGNFTLTDDSGSIYVYGCLTAEGEKKQFESLNIKEGDIIKVLAREYKNYQGVDEAVDVVFVENYGPAPETPTYTFEVTTNGNDFTITPSDNEVKYYVEVLPVEMLDVLRDEYGFQTVDDYFDYLFDEMGAGLEYFQTVSTQNLDDFQYVDPEESTNYVIAVCAVDADYKRASDVVLTNTTYGAEPTSYDLTIGETYYATFFDSKHAYIMPENCLGFVFTTPESFGDVYYDEGEKVPAGEPLVMFGIGGPGTYTLQFTTTSNESLKSRGLNNLDGTDEETQLDDDPDSYFYALSMNAEKDPGTAGLYWMNDTGAAFKNGAHKAYLKLPKTSAAKSAYLFNADVTAIKNVNVETAKPVRKALVNGQLVIKTANGTFSAAGAQMK